MRKHHTAPTTATKEGHMAKRKGSMNLSDRDRFMECFDIQPNGCWWWTGNLTSGYGYFTANGKSVRAHRFSYMEFVGPIPTDKPFLDHKCHDPATCAGGNTCPHRRCVNPNHVEPCTNAENCAPGRGNTGINTGIKQKAKTHCSKGHEYTEENTATRFDKDIGVTYRGCRQCCRESTAAHRARKRLTTPSVPKEVRSGCKYGHPFDASDPIEGRYCKICKSRWNADQRAKQKRLAIASKSEVQLVLENTPCQTQT